MKAFEDGQRVRYVGMAGLHSDLKDKVGVVTESFRLFDEQRISVLFDGEDKASHYDVEDFEAVRETYIIENDGDDITTAEMELTDVEAALIQRVCEALNDENYKYTPTLSIVKKEL